MQQPPNPYPQYPQQQPQTYYPPQQQWQQPAMPPQLQWNPQQQQQYWYQPNYTQPTTYYPTQKPSIQRSKEKRLVFLVSVIGAVLAIMIVVSSVLIGYSLFFSPSHSLEAIFAQYPTLHTEYDGTITNSIISISPVATIEMALIITSNDNQGHISGRMGILLAPEGGNPFIGTLGVDGTITFTATPMFLGVFTVFTGKVNSDSSISGTASNSTDPSETWKLFPVKGH